LSGIESTPSAPTNPPIEGIPSLGRVTDAVKYEGGVVWVLDRRAYPFEKHYVRCASLEEVAQSIEAMVTQSLGPGPTAGYGMALAARGLANESSERQQRGLELAAKRLVATRPTNDNIRLMTKRVLGAVSGAMAVGLTAEDAILQEMDRYWRDLGAQLERLSDLGAHLIREGDVILTHCWADALLIELFRRALERDVTFSVICTETRPYLQGARLTADAVAELGVDTTVVTDGMPAHLMASGRVTTFMAGADRITLDGHWVNKIGTLGIAIAAHHYSVPTFGLGFHPDPDAPTASDVTIEIRDPSEVLHCRSQRTASMSAHGYYPAFDITPPELVTAFITDRGVFAPSSLVDYFREPE
jgi:methylthioribose-1-phosphate isomerase